jgi:hypothetical protein
LLSRTGSGKIAAPILKFIVRRRRQWLAVLLMVGLAFAQIITAAHACSILTLASPQGPVQAEPPVGQAMPTDCGEMAKQSDSTINVCVSHCDFGQQVDAHADAPAAAISPQPPLLIRPVGPLIPASGEHWSLPAALAAPPPQLLFSRFLI